ncbi:uncharacterized protein LTR77_004044 [Saxophila tyrrhenica]|uniref:Uncharacterized protein n=1 Tax=Saxophila tyrrhenica TaxID=1690608 RepID=A0AAV9PFX3_9PEZI|nr:hypothetical protein LTR77_004044 [Saxophila tyrrhenica]
MKFLSLLALPALILPALAVPAPAPEAVDAVAAPLERRQISSAYSIVSDLYTEIQQYTGAINETAASLSDSSTPHQKKAAAKSYRQNIRAITAAVRAAKKETDALEPAAADAKVKRQTDQALADLVAGLLEEVSGALNNIVATLGLTSLLGSLNPLVNSLSALLISLRNVVDNLLILVKQIVDGLLTGLSIGLAGLTL